MALNTFFYVLAKYTKHKFVALEVACISCLFHDQTDKILTAGSGQISTKNWHPATTCIKVIFFMKIGFVSVRPRPVVGPVVFY